MGTPTKEAQPRRLRIVICDTGPALHLHEAAALEELKHAGEVIIPRAVDAELKQRVPEWRRLKPRWLRVRTTAAAQRRAPVLRHLVQERGQGEAEAIILAQSLKADWLLTDDAEARVVAQLVGLEVHAPPMNGPCRSRSRSRGGGSCCCGCASVAGGILLALSPFSRAHNICHDIVWHR